MIQKDTLTKLLEHFCPEKSGLNFIAHNSKGLGPFDGSRPFNLTIIKINIECSFLHIIYIIKFAILDSLLTSFCLHILPSALNEQHHKSASTWGNSSSQPVPAQYTKHAFTISRNSFNRSNQSNSYL